MDLLKSRGGCGDALRAGAPLLWTQAGRAGGLQPGGEKAPGETFQCLKGDLKRGRDFLHRQVAIVQRGMDLQ